MTYELKVNGKIQRIALAGETPLLWVLREHLKLRGTKYGCGIGSCGACTIHVEGEARRSCITPLESVGNAAVVTIEGLAGADLHPVQQAWCDQDVAQCGYCQPGQIMSATALLARTTSPSAEEMREAMAGNLCRCGTYHRIEAAIQDAAAKLRNKQRGNHDA